MNSSNVVIQLNNVNFKSPVTNLSKSGLVMWLYLMSIGPGEKVVINQSQLKKNLGITENMIARGLKDLEDKKYLVDGIFYEVPYIEITRWSNMF